MIDLILHKTTIDTMNSLGFYLVGMFTDGITTIGRFEMFGPWSTN